MKKAIKINFRTLWTWIYVIWTWIYVIWTWRYVIVSVVFSVVVLGFLGWFHGDMTFPRYEVIASVILLLLLFWGFAYIIDNNDKEISGVLRNKGLGRKYKSTYDSGIYMVFGKYLWFTMIFLLVSSWLIVIWNLGNCPAENWYPILNRTLAGITISALAFILYTFFEFMAKSRDHQLTTIHFFNSSMILLAIIFVTFLFSLLRALALIDSPQMNNGVAESSYYYYYYLLDSNRPITIIAFVVPLIVLGLFPRLSYILFDRFERKKYKPDDMYLANILEKDSQELENILRGYDIHTEREILNVFDYNLFKWFLYSDIRGKDEVRIKGWLDALIIKQATGNYFNYVYHELGIRCVKCLNKKLSGEEDSTCGYCIRGSKLSQEIQLSIKKLIMPSYKGHQEKIDEFKYSAVGRSRPQKIVKG